MLLKRAIVIASMFCFVLVHIAAAQPSYQIISLGFVDSGDTSSTGQGISPSGEFITGFSSASGVNRALRWTEAGGTVGLPNLSSPPRSFNNAQSVNNAGTVVGIGATTFFGSSPLPVIWQNGVATQLPLPAGETLGRAYSINDSAFIVGSVDGGSSEAAATFTTSSAQVIPQTMPNGGVLRTAYAVNNSGRIVGQALDPNNAAVTTGFYLDPGNPFASDLGALPGHNSAIGFAVSSNGMVAGSSSLNSGAGALPFRWSQANGMEPVPLPVGTTTGGARGINAAGWVVGTASSATAIPFLYDGISTYRLEDLIPPGTGWSLTDGTSNAAFGIADNGTITGRGLLNGVITGYALILVPEPMTSSMVWIGLIGAGHAIVRRRSR